MGLTGFRMRKCKGPWIDNLQKTFKDWDIQDQDTIEVVCGGRGGGPGVKKGNLKKGAAGEKAKQKKAENLMKDIEERALKVNALASLYPEIAELQKTLHEVMTELDKGGAVIETHLRALPLKEYVLLTNEYTGTTNLDKRGECLTKLLFPTLQKQIGEKVADLEECVEIMGLMAAFAYEQEWAGTGKGTGLLDFMKKLTEEKVGIQKKKAGSLK